MKVSTGQKVFVRSTRHGNYTGIATANFDTVQDEWYPIASAQEVVKGMSNEWEEGEAVPCRRGLNLIRPFREEPQGRGVNTERVKEASQRLLGFVIDTIELRLMVYICCLAVNEQHLKNVNDLEVKLLEAWQAKGLLSISPYVQIPMDVWLKFQEILWLAYVDIDQ